MLIDTAPVSPAKFRLDGATVKLPSVQRDDGLAYRIEALRVMLEDRLGFDRFFDVYQMLKDMQPGDDDDQLADELVSAVGPENTGYLSLVQQLIFCEDRFNEGHRIVRQ